MPSVSPASLRSWTVFLFTSVFLVGLFHLSRLSPIHGWSDDGSVYLQYARNLLDGRPYHSVLSGQALSIASPPSRYPPVLPLLLTPIVYWRGLDFLAYKALMLALFLAAAIASAYVLRSFFPPSAAIAASVCMLGSFVLWQQADHINSDFPFLLILCLSFLVSEHWTPHRHPLFWKPLLCGLLIALATATRTVGFILIPSLLLYSLWRYRRLTAETLLTCAFALLPLAVLRSLLGGGAYGGQLTSLFNWVNLRRNLIQYPLAITELSGGGLAAAAILNLLLITGAVITLRRGPQRWAAFAVCYGAVLIVWPFSDPVRFLVPLWPWMMACIFTALHAPLAATGRAHWLVCAVAGAFLAAQLPQYSAFFANSELPALNNPEINSVYEFSRRSLPAESVVAFRKPRTFSLLTGFKSIQFGALPADRMGDDLCRSGATHLLAATTIFEDDATFLKPFLARHHSQLDLLFQTPRFHLYRLPPQYCASFASRP